MTRTQKNGYKPLEVWRQDHQIPDLWHSKDNLMVNSAALSEREFYFELVRIPSSDFVSPQPAKPCYKQSF
jgi:hypothetical protein